MAHPESAAIVVRPPGVSTVIARQSVTFTCVAYGSPAPNVQWTTLSGKDLTAMATNTPITTSDATMVVSVLELCDVDASSADTYTCNASNGVTRVGFAPSTASFTLSVTQSITAPPAIVARPPEDIQVNEGESVQVTCIAYGNPVPDIYWSKPGCLRMTNGTTNIYTFSNTVTMNDVTVRWSTLQICNASADDSTQYSCWADNGVTGVGLEDPNFNFNIHVASIATGALATETETVYVLPENVVPYIIVLAILIVAVIVLAIVVVLFGAYAMNKNCNKTKYTMKPDDKEFIMEDIEHD